LSLTEKLSIFNEEIGKQEKDYKEKKTKFEEDSRISVKAIVAFTFFSILSVLCLFYIEKGANLEAETVNNIKEILVLISGVTFSLSIAEKTGEIEEYFNYKEVYFLSVIILLFINIALLMVFPNYYNFIILSYFFILLFLNIKMLYKKTPERDLSDLKIELDKKNQIKTEYWNKTKLFIISEINKEVDDIKGFAILEELISENKLNNLRPVLEELGFEKAKDKGFNSFLDYKIKKLENRVLLEMENE
jgi:hypothetical protein